MEYIGNQSVNIWDGPCLQNWSKIPVVLVPGRGPGQPLGAQNITVLAAVLLIGRHMTINADDYYGKRSLSHMMTVC